MDARALPLLALATALTAACNRDIPVTTGLEPAFGHAHPDIKLTTEMHKEIAALRPLFAKYHDQDKALADGWQFVGPCVSDPELGGMGDHYSLNAEDDFGRGDGTYNLENPQYLVYAPQKNGSRRLAALDYTVPYEKWDQLEPPAFFGIPFTRNDGFEVWMFHIWLFQHNRAGIFANFNPDVAQC